MAEVENVSLGRAMGDWLGDTADAAAMMTKALEDAKGKPREVLRRLQSLSQGVVDATEETLSAMRSGRSLSDVAPPIGEALGQKLRGQAAAEPRAGRGASSPRPVIRGGKSTGKRSAGRKL
jgi:hypothetical protein